MIILSLLMALSQPTFATILPCGLHGTISQRVSDCASEKNFKKFSWALVMRDVNGNESWMDKGTGLIWSHVLERKYTHTEALPKNSAGIPKQVACGGSLARIEGAQFWRMAELTEFFDAYKHNSYRVLESISDWIWTATLDDPYTAHAVHGMSAPDYGVYSRDRKFSVRCVTREE